MQERRWRRFTAAVEHRREILSNAVATIPARKAARTPTALMLRAE